MLPTKLSYNGFPVMLVSNQLVWSLNAGFPDALVEDAVKCECGAEIVHNVKPFHPGHSAWCPVAEPV